VNLISEELKHKAKQAREVLGSRLANPPTVAELARLCMTNHRALQIAFKAVFSQTINEVSAELRMNRAKWLLVNTEYTLDEIAEETGYHDKASLCKYFKRYVGITPGIFREKEDKEI
jgi:transcriptional regulator GlxA family with amidase domain